MNLGVLVLIIAVLGYLSNLLNGHFLNHRITHWLYRVGAIIHETSHAIMCILTGAKITEFKVFTRQPHVSHTKSKIPILGQTLISLAPIAGGLLFIYTINNYLLNNYFTIITPSSWGEITNTVLLFLQQINFTEWQSWVMILLFINVGAMIGPSTKDLKNIWPIIIIMFFINWPLLANICLIAISLIIINIAIQLIIITIRQFLKLIPR
ncbi:hypothetical protein ISR92_01200 [Patescibacteria group bacterium]|nr:hypothetical protein [Patescibacteria group bacterium]